MDSLETQLRRCTRSWYAWGGAAVVSTGFLIGIALMKVIPEKEVRAELPPLLGAAAPSSPVAAKLDAPPRPKPLAGSSLADAFKFDPTKSDQPPEVPVGKLDAGAFGGSMKFFNADAGFGFDPEGVKNSSLAVSLGLRHTFEVQKPQVRTDRFIILERDKVDEIPVWLYGPQPRIPTKFERTDWHVLVFYAITEKGRTENIYILDSTDPSLEQSVKDAIAAWSFRPARKSGQPVRIMAQQDVSYKPTNKSPFEL